MQDLQGLLAAHRFDCAPIFDGEIIRFDREGKHLAGWFRGQELKGPQGPIFVAEFGDWSTGERHSWRSDAGATYTKEELEEVKTLFNTHRQAVNRKKEEEQKAAALRAREIWDSSEEGVLHPYETKKGVRMIAARVHGESLVVPIYQGTLEKPELVSLQFIDQHGGKKFLPGGKLKGSWSFINKGDRPDSWTEKPTYLVEGFATGESVLEGVGSGLVIIAFNAANLVNVARSFPVSPKRVVIAADNDQWTNGNPGVQYALRAAAIFQENAIPAELRYPEFSNTVENQAARLTDWNDWHQKEGLESLKQELVKGKTLPLNKSQRVELRGLPGMEDFTPMPISLSKNGNPIPPPQDKVAEKLYEGFGDVLLREDRDIFLWQGTHWEEQKAFDFRCFTKRAIQRLRSGLATDKETDAVFNLFVSILPSSRHSFFTQDPRLANFQDGTLEIKRESGGQYVLEFREHRRGDLLTWMLPYSYRSPRPKNPIFEEWLSRCFQGDPDQAGKIRALKQLGGATLISLFPRIGFLYGPGGTGKSTFAKLCLAFLGKENYSSVEPKDQEGFLKETMIGKQANIVTDISSTHLDPAAWKRVEDRVPELVNRKNKKAVTAFLPAFHLYCGNKLPKGIDHESTAFDRRFTIVEFARAIPEIAAGKHTRDFEQVILENGPGAVLEFFEEGLRDLCAAGGLYTNPASGISRLQAWKDSESLTAQILEAIYHGEIGTENAPLFLDKGNDAVRIRTAKLNTLLATHLGCSLPTKQFSALLHELDARGYPSRGAKGIRYTYGIGVPGDGDLLPKTGKTAF